MLKNYSLREIVNPENLRQSFASIAKNEPTVTQNELTPTTAGSIRVEAQGQRSRDHNKFVTGLITADDCFAVCENVKEIGVTFTDNSFKIRRFGKDIKNVV